MNISERLTPIFLEVLGLERDDFDEEVQLVEDLEIDSAERVELIVHMEKEFGVRVTVEQFKRMARFGDLVRFLEALLTAGAAQEELAVVPT